MGNGVKLWAVDSKGILAGLLVILAVLLLSGCDCVAGSDAITTTVCKTDKPE